MGCEGCGIGGAAIKVFDSWFDRLWHRVFDRRKSFGVLSFLKAKREGKVEEIIKGVRLSICNACNHRHSGTGDRLFRIIKGKPYCGKPRRLIERRNEYARGCGCNLIEKAKYKYSRCPRAEWGPGAKLGNNVNVVKLTDGMPVLKGVHDLHACVKMNPSDGTGMGDMFVAITIIEGIKRTHPDRRVRLVITNVNAGWNPKLWARFFFDGEIVHSPDQSDKGEFESWLQAETFSLEDAKAINSGLLRHEQFARYSEVYPAIPEFKYDRDDLFYAQAEFSEPKIEGQKVILLSPFANSVHRMWPILYSAELIVELKKRGHWVAIVDGGDGERSKKLPCMRYWNFGPSKTAAMFKYSDLVIGMDSSMPHFAGMLGCKALALCGPTDGKTVFGFYPTVHTLQAGGECTACNFSRESGARDECRVGCRVMHDLSPIEVADWVDRILEGDDNARESDEARREIPSSECQVGEDRENEIWQGAINSKDR